MRVREGREASGWRASDPAVSRGFPAAPGARPAARTPAVRTRAAWRTAGPGRSSSALVLAQSIYSSYRRHAPGALATVFRTVCARRELLLRARPRRAAAGGCWSGRAALAGREENSGAAATSSPRQMRRTERLHRATPCSGTACRCSSRQSRRVATCLLIRKAFNTIEQKRNPVVILGGAVRRGGDVAPLRWVDFAAQSTAPTREQR